MYNLLAVVSVKKFSLFMLFLIARLFEKSKNVFVLRVLVVYAQYYLKIVSWSSNSVRSYNFVVVPTASFML